MKKRFTKSWVEGLKPEARTRYTDTTFPGLTLRVTPAGSKTFYYRARHKNMGGIVERRIGRFGQWTVDQAREKAIEYSAAFNRGVDPDLEAKQARTKRLTFRAAAEQYLDDLEHRVNNGERAPKTLKLYRGIYTKHLTPMIGGKSLHSITSQQIRDGLREKGVAASLHNKILDVIRNVYSHAAEYMEFDGEVPLDGVRRRTVTKRERFLRPGEAARFFESLALEPQLYQDAVLLLLTTGQRKLNVFSMEWDEIDFDGHTWTIPAHKTKKRRTHTVPLIGDAMAILERRRREAAPGARYVLPGVRSPHIPENTNEFWERITTRAGMRPNGRPQRLVIHDLRRTLGSWQAKTGVGIQQIARSLGHTDIGITASTYAHLDAEGARGGIEAAVDAINRAAGRDVSATDRKLDALLDGLSEDEKAALMARLQG